MIDRLKRLNTDLPIHSVCDTAFSKYGKVINNYNFSEYINIMNNRPIPAEGNVYVASDPELMAAAPTQELSNIFYGKMPIEVGYCNGTTSHLNALEYHKCSEIDLAITDLVLLLGDIRDISANTYASSRVEAFYVPAGTACELYGTTLHFAPCKLSDSGFKSVIVLADGTNNALEPLPAPTSDEDKLLWMQNKWLIAHPESKPASLGAHAGITGPNIEVKYI